MTAVEKYSRAIRVARTIAGYSSGDFAAALGISGQMLSMIENGHRGPERYVTRVCDAAGMTLSQFDIVLDLIVAVDRSSKAAA